MARFDIAGTDLELPRNLALLDTNVLVAFADNEDNNHEQALLFLENVDNYSLTVAPPVVIEACGLLLRRRNQDIVLNLLGWLLTPGNVILLPAPHSPKDVGSTLSSHRDWMRKYEIDYVDTYLMEIAHRITCICEFRPYIPIITFDTRDFFKCALKGYSFSLYDMRNLELIEFET